MTDIREKSAAPSLTKLLPRVQVREPRWVYLRTLQLYHCDPQSENRSVHGHQWKQLQERGYVENAKTHANVSCSSVCFLANKASLRNNKAKGKTCSIFWQLVFKIKITRGIFLEVQQFLHGIALIVRQLLSKYQEMLKVSNRDY